MRDRRIGFVVAIVVVAMAGVGVAMAATRSTSAKSGTVMTAKVGKYGTVLVAANGKTLYRYTPDKKNVSVCNGACVAYWPPLLVKGTAKPTAGSGVSAKLLGVTMRSNGAHQVTYAGFPLYYYVGRQEGRPGERRGIPEDVVRRQRDRRSGQEGGGLVRRHDDEEVRLGLSPRKTSPEMPSPREPEGPQGLGERESPTPAGACQAPSGTRLRSGRTRRLKAHARATSSSPRPTAIQVTGDVPCPPVVGADAVATGSASRCPSAAASR